MRMQHQLCVPHHKTNEITWTNHIGTYIHQELRDIYMLNAKL